jgi:hypothetical protein
MPENSAAAMVTGGSELIDCTLETIEHVCFSGKRNLKCLVVGVAANFAGRHLSFLRLIVLGQGRRDTGVRIEV